MIASDLNLARVIKEAPDLAVYLLSDKRLRGLIRNISHLISIIEAVPKDVLPLLSEYRYLLQSNEGLLAYFGKFLSGLMVGETDAGLPVSAGFFFSPTFSNSIEKFFY